MKILIFNWRDIHHPQSGGAETYLYECATRWTKSGHEVAWISGNPRRAPRAQTEEGGIVGVRVGDRFRVYTAARNEYADHWKGWPDVVLDSMNGIPFFTPMYVEEPVVCLFHHRVASIFFRELPFPLSLAGFLIERLFPLFYRNTLLVAVSPSSLDALVELGFQRSQLSLLPFGATLPPGPVNLERNEDSVLSLGRLKRYKRLTKLIEAAKAVVVAVPDARFYIAGRGDEEPALLRAIRDSGLDGHVRLLGYVSEEEKARLLSRCKVFVTTSEREGWGISVIEAATFGTPAVGFDVPGIRDAIVNGTTGIVVHDGNADELAAAIAGLLTDEERRHALGRKARERAETLTWDHTAERLLERLQSATRSRPAA